MINRIDRAVSQRIGHAGILNRAVTNLEPAACCRSQKPDLIQTIHKILTSTVKLETAIVSNPNFIFLCLKYRGNKKILKYAPGQSLRDANTPAINPRARNLLAFDLRY